MRESLRDITACNMKYSYYHLPYRDVSDLYSDNTYTVVCF